MTAKNSEIEQKLARLRQFIDQNGYDAVRLQTPNFFAWLTGGGRNYVDVTSTWTGAALYITRDKVIGVMAENEADRIQVEELPTELGCEVRVYPWWGSPLDVVSELHEGSKIAGDAPFPGVEPIAEQLRSFMYPLTEPEMERYRQLASEVSDVWIELIPNIREGMTELDIDAWISSEYRKRNIHPNVMMVAADERAVNFMHPLPTDKKLKKYVVISVCAARGGLVVSQTRSFHLGKAEEELKDKHRAASQIAAACLARMKVGASLEDLYTIALKTYAELGWENGWKRHTFGGKTGYRTREFTLGPASQGAIEANTAWAWNPTVEGTKSEDTVIVGEQGVALLGEDARWPQLSFEIEGTAWNRPDILEI